MAQITCPKCGKQLPEDAKFCSYCGCSIPTESSAPEKVEENAESRQKEVRVKDIWVCPDCGLEMTEEKESCPNCACPKSAFEHKQVEEPQVEDNNGECKDGKKKNHVKPLLICISILFIIGLLCLFLIPQKVDKCLSFDYHEDGTASIVGIDDIDKLPATLKIPSETRHDATKYQVTTIGANAFRGCNKLTSITIPYSIVNIEKDAFNGCANLQRVTIHHSSVKIAPTAFVKCDNLINKKEFLPSECTVNFRITDYNHYSGCSGYYCNMYEGSKHFLTDSGGTVLTDYITIPEGQRWTFKDFDADYKVAADNRGAAWITRPSIYHGRKKYLLPDDGRNFMLFPGDKFRVGVYIAANKCTYVDVSVIFFIEYI